MLNRIHDFVDHDPSEEYVGELRTGHIDTLMSRMQKNVKGTRERFELRREVEAFDVSNKRDNSVRKDGSRPTQTNSIESFIN